MISVIVHINNEEPVVGELDELPSQSASLIILQNPRRRDGKDVHYLDEETNRMIVPFHRINFIQVMPTADSEDIIGFVRE